MSSPLPQATPLRSPSRLLYAAILSAALALSACSKGEAEDAEANNTRSALTVELVQPRMAEVSRGVQADGNIMAWHEASVGAEVSGRIDAVPVEVGDRVHRGQVLARFDTLIMAAEHGQAEAAAQEAAAAYAEAKSSAARSFKLHEQGFLGEQALLQSQTAELAAKARVAQTHAAREASRLHLNNAVVKATTDGVISRVNVVKGSIIPAGTEMFALIEGGRLEWRAQVSASEMSRIRVGMPATVDLGQGHSAKGKVRLLSPTVDVQSRTGLVYIDLEPSEHSRAGMYVTGRIESGSGSALLLPQSAVMLRDGFSFVMVVDENAVAHQVMVQLGQRVGGEMEVLDGLSAQDRVVAKGAAFLADGDRVQISTSKATDAETQPEPAAAAEPASAEE